jgi:hypothetical protein
VSLFGKGVDGLVGGGLVYSREKQRTQLSYCGECDGRAMGFAAEAIER